MSGMGNQYTFIADYYDRLNAGVDYAGYANFIDRMIKKHYLPKDKSAQPIVLDIGCGTGNVTLELAKLGYDMIGVDCSGEMLSAAARKAEETGKNGKSVLWLEQDMRFFELYGTVDATVSCLDSLNYLTDLSSLRSCFKTVHNYLNPNGLFIFDINTPYRFKNVYGQNDYILEADGVYCGWRNFYNEKTGLCRFELSFFAEETAPRRSGSGFENQRYVRFDEEQRERCYSSRTVNSALKECGFEIISVSGGFGGEKPEENSEKWYYVCKKLRETTNVKIQ